jgi:superfamily II DNA or RNA helicase
VLAPGYQWYIINYQALRRNDYFDLIKALPICVLICDESHNVKNPSAAQSKRVLELSQLPTVTHRFLLSATPIKKEADDLYMQLHIVDPRVFHSQQRYLNDYCNADYTRYGARNVRLQNHAKTRLQYVNPRTKCTNPESPTFGKTFEPVRYEYDWSRNDPQNGKPYTRIEIPAVPACECCPPYEFNTETVTEVIPPPPPPSVQPLKVNLADWLTNGEAENAEKIESVDAFKRRKLFRINSTYVAPEPTTVVHEKGISPSAYIMGFSYKDVGMYLPPVVSPTCLVPMNSDTRQVYESVKDSWRAAIPDIGNIDLGSAMAAMHALRVLTCCDNKLEALANLIDDAPEGNAHVIFCAYEMTAKVVAQHLQGIKDPKVMPRFIAGHIKPDERDAYAASMARDGLPIVATLQSMSEGVDLSYARFVYFFEEDWTPGVMYQALSRVQRERAKEKDGRSPVPTSEIESIVCNYIMCESSIDEHVHMVSQDRTKNARDILRVELAVSR